MSTFEIGTGATISVEVEQESKANEYPHRYGKWQILICKSEYKTKIKEYRSCVECGKPK